MSGLTEDRRRQLQRANLVNLLRNGAFEFIDRARPWFPYTSGQVGPYYVQSVAVERDGAAYAAAIDAVVEIIRAEAGGFDAISGGETRDWDFSNPAACALRVPHIKIYKDGKMLGADPAGKRILHVADLNNEGSSMRDLWKPYIEGRGGRLVGVVFFVDRLEEGADVMRDLGLPSFSVVPLDEPAWDIAQAEGFVSEWTRASLAERGRDRNAWAERVLLSNPDYFRDFYGNAATSAKAEKILRAYPRISGALRAAAGQGDSGGGAA